MSKWKNVTELEVGDIIPMLAFATLSIPDFVYLKDHYYYTFIGDIEVEIVGIKECPTPEHVSDNPGFFNRLPSRSSNE